MQPIQKKGHRHNTQNHAKRVYTFSSDPKRPIIIVNQPHQKTLEPSDRNHTVSQGSGDNDISKIHKNMLLCLYNLEADGNESHQNEFLRLIRHYDDF